MLNLNELRGVLVVIFQISIASRPGLCRRIFESFRLSVLLRMKLIEGVSAKKEKAATGLGTLGQAGPLIGALAGRANFWCPDKFR